MHQAYSNYSGGKRPPPKDATANDTNYTIMRFYGSNKGTESWEEDILGRDVLRPGQSVRIDFGDGTDYCKFDFRAVFDDDDILVAKDINVCKIGTYTYS
jgi:hypothetical protein